MTKVQMLIPMDPEEFWTGIRNVVDESIKDYFVKIKQAVTDNRPPLLKATDVCSILKISKPTIYEWLKIGKLPSVKSQSRRYFRWKDVDELIEKNRKNPQIGGI